jgi:hypothetical protein
MRFQGGVPFTPLFLSKFLITSAFDGFFFDPYFFCLGTMLFKSQDPWPHSHRDVLEHYYQQYDKQIASGEFAPFVYPFGGYGSFVVIIYLLIPHQNRPWLKKCRFLVFAWLFGFAAYNIRYTRARGMAPALGMGLMHVWSVVWVAAILVWNDAQTEFQRVERTEGVFGSATPKEKGSSEHSEKSVANSTVSNGQIAPKEHLGPRDRHGEFAWQPYPLSPFIERVDWVGDIFCNFRGAGWNWRTSAVPPPPKHIQEQLYRNSASSPAHSFRVHSSQSTLYPTRRALLISNFKTVIFGYLVLDALKTFMMHDPYFWGQLDRPPPAYFPVWLTARPALVHVYRLALSMLTVKWALQAIFAFAPLLFAGLLGRARIGARAEPWIFPETWGPFTAVLDRGLAGWWSSWWHQTFRFAFEQPGLKIAAALGMQRKSVPAKMLQLLCAFGLSGALHASGTYTAAGDTKPLSNSMTFFLLQAVGVAAEVLITQSVRSTGVQRHVPTWLKRAFRFVYVHVWFYYTAHLLCNDFALSGIWLFESVPVSLFRSLGLGVEGEGWWCWGGQVVRWHTGSSFWKSGIAL